MILDSGKYFLYRHIRLDKNEPFYIGIGTKNLSRNSYKKIYWRAFSMEKRNNIWVKITSKSNYEVEILLESDDYEFIKEKEIEFIFLYGRIDLKTGILANLTDGGEGTKNVIVSEEWKKKQSNAKRGKTRKLSSIELTAKSRRKKSYQYDLEGNFIKEWESCREAANSLGKKEDNISSCLRGKSKSAFGFQWFYEFKGIKIKNMEWKSSNKQIKKMKESIYKRISTVE